MGFSKAVFLKEPAILPLDYSNTDINIIDMN
jgi:hypothetical protein